MEMIRQTFFPSKYNWKALSMRVRRKRQMQRIISLALKGWLVCISLQTLMQPGQMSAVAKVKSLPWRPHYHWIPGATARLPELFCLCHSIAGTCL